MWQHDLVGYFLKVEYYSVAIPAYLAILSGPEVSTGSPDVMSSQPGNRIKDIKDTPLLQGHKITSPEGRKEEREKF